MSQSSGGMSRRGTSAADRSREHNRTTAMLIGVVMCFVATEVPQGIVAFLAGVDERYFETVYAPLADVWDALVLVNSAVNFLLYCAMSRHFRDTFAAIFLGQKWRLLHDKLQEQQGSRRTSHTRTVATQAQARICVMVTSPCHVATCKATDSIR
jgi:hypothetical protein